jgi:uncharacterized integral membrane protein
MKRVTDELKKTNYSQELKGLGLGIVVLLLLAVMNNYAGAIKQLIFSDKGMLLGLSFITAVVIAIVFTMYYRVTMLKKRAIN